MLEPGSVGFCRVRRVWHPDRLPPLPTVSHRLEHPKKAKCVVATGAPGIVGERGGSEGGRAPESLLCASLSYRKPGTPVIRPATDGQQIPVSDQKRAWAPARSSHYSRLTKSGKLGGRPGVR